MSLHELVCYAQEVQLDSLFKSLYQRVSCMNFWHTDSVSQLTISMLQSQSWDADSHSYSQGIILLLWNPEVQYFIHNSPQLEPILSQMNPAHTFIP
jgi:hypothetical protein